MGADKMARAPAGDGVRLWQVAVATGLAMAILAGLMPERFADPFIRNDDYMFHFPLPDLALTNTLTEGRWGNQLWAWRGIPGQRQIYFAFSIGLWCLTCALIATRVAGPRLIPVLLTTLALAAMPQMGGVHYWYNALIAANLVLLASVVAILSLSNRGVVLAFPLMAVAALMTYPTNAFLLLGVALAIARPGPVPRQALILSMVMFVSLVAGIILTYTINWCVHGVFGVQLAEWRAATPATDLTSLVANIATLGADAIGEGEGARSLRMLSGFGVMALPLLGTAMALQSSRPDWLRAMLIAGSICLALVIAQTLKDGTNLPSRATGFAWVFIVLILSLAMLRARAPAVRTITGLLLLGAAAGGFYGWRTGYPPEIERYQAFTREIGARVAEFSPQPGVILVTGRLGAHPETEVLNEPIGFEFRLRDLTGAETWYCDASIPLLGPEDVARHHPVEHPRWQRIIDMQTLCATHAAALSALAEPWPGPRSVARVAPGVLGLRLGE